MIFKDYYSEDILLRRFYYYSSTFDLISIKYNNKKEDFKRPSNINEFIEKVFFDYDGYDEILAVNQFAKVSLSKEKKEFKLIGNKSYSAMFNSISTLLNSDNEEVDLTLSEATGIEVQEKNELLDDIECEIDINCKSDNYIVKIINTDISIEDVLFMLQIYIYNYCENEKIDIEEIFTLAAKFIDSFGENIELYIDTITIDNSIFPFINNTQDIFLLVIADYILTHYQLQNEEFKIKELD